MTQIEWQERVHKIMDKHKIARAGSLAFLSECAWMMGLSLGFTQENVPETDAGGDDEGTD